MLVFNPQWQGAGNNNTIKHGNEAIKTYFSDCDYRVVSLYDKGSVQQNNIINYEAVINQLGHFRNLLNESKPEQVITIGGDCGIEVIPVSYLNGLYGSIGIIWLDAHADLNTPGSSPSKTFHGMPVRQLLGEGDAAIGRLLISEIYPWQIFYIGLRDLDIDEKRFIQQRNIFNTSKVNYIQIKQKLIDLNFSRIYVHFDLDVIDPSFYPYTMCPVNNGLGIEEIESFLEQLNKDFILCGLAICESTARDKEQLLPIKHILNFAKELQYSSRY